MDITAAWDAVLTLQGDIERIVSQAVRLGRVSPNDAEDVVNTAMVTCVGLAESYDVTIGTFAAYALGTIRLQLQGKGHGITPDAMERAVTIERTSSADISAKARKGGFRPARAVATRIPQLDRLNPIQRRVAGLLAAGMGIGQIARKLGMTTHGVKIVAGQALGGIKGEGKSGKLLGGSTS